MYVALFLSRWTVATCATPVWSCFFTCSTHKLNNKCVGFFPGFRVEKSSHCNHNYNHLFRVLICIFLSMREICYLHMF